MMIRFVMAFVMLLPGVAWAQDRGFDPRQPCGQILNQASDVDRMMVAAWTFGFLAGNDQGTRPIDRQNNETLLGNLQRACAQDQSKTLLQLVGASKRAPATAAGSEGQARALLMQFYEPGADHRALTQALLPTEADIRTVYSDPLATALVNTYRAALTPDVAFAPKPDHNDVLLVHTTTRSLAEGQAVLREFPGGYKDVVQYFRADVPIVRFKFVTKGETLGLAFDGLMYVNDRWVIMPKPWRSLPQ